MDSLGSRIQYFRKSLSLSQSALADKIGSSKAQIIRYETKGAQPPADVLNKIADVLNTTTDYLLNGTKNEKAQKSLKDSELLQQFKAMEELDENDKSTIKDIIDAFIKRSKLRNIAAL